MKKKKKKERGNNTCTFTGTATYSKQFIEAIIKYNQTLTYRPEMRSAIVGSFLLDILSTGIITFLLVLFNKE